MIFKEEVTESSFIAPFHGSDILASHLYYLIGTAALCGIFLPILGIRISGSPLHVTPWKGEDLNPVIGLLAQCTFHSTTVALCH